MNWLVVSPNDVVARALRRIVCTKQQPSRAFVRNRDRSHPRLRLVVREDFAFFEERGRGGALASPLRPADLRPSLRGSARLSGVTMTVACLSRRVWAARKGFCPMPKTTAQQEELVTLLLDPVVCAPTGAVNVRPPAASPGGNWVGRPRGSDAVRRGPGRTNRGRAPRASTLGALRRFSSTRCRSSSGLPGVAEPAIRGRRRGRRPRRRPGDFPGAVPARRNDQPFIRRAAVRPDPGGNHRLNPCE